MPEHRIYPPADRPLVEVQPHGAGDWLLGELRAWWWRGDMWQAEVEYAQTGHTSRRVDIFTTDQVREVDEDDPKWDKLMRRR